MKHGKMKHAKKHHESGGCPYCGAEPGEGNIDYHGIQVDDDRTASQEASCAKCGESWHEVYTRTSVSSGDGKEDVPNHAGRRLDMFPALLKAAQAVQAFADGWAQQDANTPEEEAERQELQQVIDKLRRVVRKAERA